MPLLNTNKPINWNAKQINTGTKLPTSTWNPTPMGGSTGVQIGSKAKAPEANVKPATTTIPTNQIANTQPVRNNLPNQTSIPTPNTVPNPIQATAPTQTPATTTAPTQSTQPINPTYMGIMGELLKRAQEGSPAYNQSVQNLADFNRGLAQQYGDIESRPIPLEFQQGREQVLARQAASEQAALQGAVTQQQQQQQQQFSALGTALGTIPEALRYGGGGGGFDPSTVAPNYAQEVLSGKRTYNDAVEAMALNGNVGKQFLDNEITKANPNFNFSQAQTLASVQGTVGPAVQYANTSLDALTDAIKGTRTVGQGSNVPIINQLGNIISEQTGYGGSETQALKSAVAEARAALTNVFIQKGVTPTAAGDQANALIPNNPTPQQIEAAKQTLSTFGMQTQSIYGNPGQSGIQPQSGGSIWSW